MKTPLTGRVNCDRNVIRRVQDLLRPRRPAASALQYSWRRALRRCRKHRDSVNGSLLSEVPKTASVHRDPSDGRVDRWGGPIPRAADLELTEFWKAQNGQQTGDPAKLARALITVTSQEPPPRRFIAGADAIGTAEQKVADLQAQIDANRELSTSLAFD